MTTTENLAEIPALAATTIVEAFRLTVSAHPDRVAVRTPDDAVSYTFADLRERSERLAAGLHGLGLRRGDTLGIMLVNRPEFHVVDLAALCVGATPFSVYNTSAPGADRLPLRRCGNAPRGQRAPVPGPPDRRARCGDAARDDRDHRRRGRETLPDGAISLAQAEAAADGTFDLEASLAAVEPTDALTLIYTSGTTGPPKGVMLTHAQPDRDDRAGCTRRSRGRTRRRRLVPAVRPHRRPLGLALLPR